MRTEPPPAPVPRRKSRRRFVAKVLLANLIVFATVFAIAELGVRIWREGGIGAGLASLVEPTAVPKSLGTGDWLVPCSRRGYALRPGHDGVNTQGIRHAELATPKPERSRRLLVLGDSVAWPDDGFVAMVRRELAAAGGPPVEVINAAVPGYTTHQERIHCEMLFAAVAPDVVVLQYCCNDNHRFLHHLVDGHWLITTEARRALLPEGDDPWTRFCRWSYVAVELRQRLFALGGDRSGAFPWRSDPSFAAAWRDDGWTIVDDEIGVLHRQLHAAAVPFVLLAVPYEPQLRDASLHRDRDHTLLPQRRLAARCAALGIPFVDLQPAFERHRDEALHTDGIHLTARGHELVATELLRHLYPLVR